MSYDTQVTEMYEFLKQKFRGKRTKQEKRTDVQRASRVHHKIKGFHQSCVRGKDLPVRHRFPR